jgi:hypothetical protein
MARSSRKSVVSGPSATFTGGGTSLAIHKNPGEPGIVPGESVTGALNNPQGHELNFLMCHDVRQ